MYDIIEAYLKYKNDHLKIIKEKHENKFDDHRKIDEKMEKYINKKLDELPFQQLLQQLSLNDLLRDFDAVSLYPSAMSDEKSIYLRIKTGYSYTPDLNSKIVKKINGGSFTQGSAILKIKYCNPKILIVQHLPVSLLRSE